MNLKIFFVTLALSLPFWWGINVFQGNLENYFYAQISQPFEEIIFVKIPPKPQKPELDLQVKAATSVKLDVIEAENILFNKNINQPLPIASLTKLMTATIILEDKNSPCLHCYKKECKKMDCMKNITPAEVLEKIKSEKRFIHQDNFSVRNGWDW